MHLTIYPICMLQSIYVCSFLMRIIKCRYINNANHVDEHRSDISSSLISPWISFDYFLKAKYRKLPRSVYVLYHTRAAQNDLTCDAKINKIGDITPSKKELVLFQNMCTHWLCLTNWQISPRTQIDQDMTDDVDNLKGNL